MLINRNLNIAIETALKAGEVIMQIYNSAFNIEFKDDN
jgi:3'(2'), 5'-bisphosphate nucleotidase